MNFVLYIYKYEENYCIIRWYVYILVNIWYISNACEDDRNMKEVYMDQFLLFRYIFYIYNINILIFPSGNKFFCKSSSK